MNTKSYINIEDKNFSTKLFKQSFYVFFTFLLNISERWDLLFLSSLLLKNKTRLPIVFKILEICCLFIYLIYYLGEKYDLL